MWHHRAGIFQEVRFDGKSVASVFNFKHHEEYHMVFEVGIDASRDALLDSGKDAATGQKHLASAHLS